MISRLFLILFFNLYVALTLMGQTGMNFQALARDAVGRVLANQQLTVHIAFSSRGNINETYYAEIHSVQTDAFGLFSLTTGEGRPEKGQISDVPWSSQQIWLDVALQTPSSSNFDWMQSIQLQAVPYAFYARSANHLVPGEQTFDTYRQKNQSIRWTTGGNALTVPGTHFIGTRDSRDLVIKTNNTARAVLTKEGQLKIYGGTTGDDQSQASYPVLIQGSGQGIHIKVNGSRNGDNNFLAFGDTEEFLWGAVEGQTFEELEEDWEYKLQIALFTLTGVGLVAQGIGVGIEAAGLYAAGTGAAASLIFAFAAAGFYAQAVATTAAGIVIGVQATALAAEAATWGVNIRKDIGVTYSSGKGDYAEWLERDPAERDLQFGEIVGVKGGKVSLRTYDADHVLVISTSPIFLGNMPQREEEHKYEKVAFLGQVPVRVAGKVEQGDYILASGNNDGMGIAIKPANMKIADFPQVVGIAWESAPHSPVNIVKIGVGINSNDLAPAVEALSGKVDNIIGFLEGKEPLYSGSGRVATISAKEEAPQEMLFTDQEFDRMIDADAAAIRKFYEDLKIQLEKQGTVIPDQPGLQALFRDPVPALKAMRRDPALAQQWARVDHQIKYRK
jgi:hypothetical protein